MSKGKIENFGRPIDLIKDESSILHELVYSLPPKEIKKLVEIAEKVALSRKKSLNYPDLKTDNDANETIPHETDKFLPK